MKANKDNLPTPTASPVWPTSDWPPYKTKSVKDLHLPEACPDCGGSGYFRQNVQVGHADFGRLIACACRLQEQNRVRQQQSQLKGWLVEATFENYKINAANQSAVQVARKFAQDPRAWLTLWGCYGPGKTHLLAAVVNHCLADHIQAVYYTLPDLLDLLRGSYSTNSYTPLFDYLRRIQVLALDEVDKANWKKEWAVEKIFQLLDARYRRLEELGTLLALNADPHTALTDAAGSPLGYLFSRMYDERSQIIHLAAADARPVTKSLRNSASAPEAN